MPIKVVCALIIADGKVLAAQRGPHMQHAGLWEFPGGKIELGETPETALIREIKEELGLDIQPVKALPPYLHTYPHATIHLQAFVAHIIGGEICTYEHAQALFMHPDTLPALEWVAADLPLLAYCTQLCQP